MKDISQYITESIYHYHISKQDRLTKLNVNDKDIVNGVNEYSKTKHQSQDIIKIFNQLKKKLLPGDWFLNFKNDNFSEAEFNKAVIEWVYEESKELDSFNNDDTYDILYG